MKNFRVMNRLVQLAAVTLLLLTGIGAAADPLPDSSYYQLDVQLESQRGERFPFADLHGGPAIVSMFYGSCPHVCPMIISTIQQIESKLPVELREELQVVMVSIDPERDTPAALLALASERNVNDRWVLARTTLADTRALAAVLGIKYKALPDGQFNHTSTIILLDAKGNEISRSSKLGSPDEAFVAQVAASLRKP